jgi:hypothetical protein
VVLGPGFLLVMLPFVFIPWMDERDRRRAPCAADRLVLEEAGINDAGDVLITTHDECVVA